jgi:hypothetical protein
VAGIEPLDGEEWQDTVRRAMSAAAQETLEALALDIGIPHEDRPLLDRIRDKLAEGRDAGERQGVQIGLWRAAQGR